MSSTGSSYGTGDFTSRSFPEPPSVPNDHKLNVSLPGPLRWPPAVICDFDDTTAVENVAELLLEHFSEDGAWRTLRQQQRDRLITLKEYQEQAFRNTRASKEAMVAHVKDKATLRPHFKDLWRYCRARRIPLAIVTVGLDFYVDALLEREDLGDVPRYSVKTTFTSEGITYQYPYSWDGSGASPAQVCRHWGTCKCSVLAMYRRRGHSIVYVGDGRSDLCPASIADQVFARSQLADLCHEKGMPYHEFQDFQDVIRGLESVTDLGGHAQQGETG